MEEIWKSVTFDEDYEVSNFGNVRRKSLCVKGKNNSTRNLPHKNLHIGLYGNSSHVSIRGKSCGVASLVAMAFITNGIMPKQVHHKNGNPMDNRLSNIEIGQKQSVFIEGNKELSEIEYIKLNYDVSRDGVITRKIDNRVLKGVKNTKGYLVVRLKLPLLSKNKDRRKPYKIHRLVAMFYLDDYFDKPQVNHKNGIKTDNRVENLEMVTNRENVLHRWRCLESSKRKANLETYRDKETGKFSKKSK